MGLLDRLKSAKQWAVTPLSLTLVREELPAVVTAGTAVRIAVIVEGEDELTEGIDLLLLCSSSGERTRIPLGSVPVAPGRHDVEVQVPLGVAPSCYGATSYDYRVEQRRTRGVTASDIFGVDVITGAESVYWPDGPRQSPGEGISVALAEDVFAVGSPVEGHVLVTGSGSVDVEIGATIDKPRHVEGRTKAQQHAEYTAHASAKLSGSGSLPFSLVVPAGAPPSLTDGLKTTIVWEIRAKQGKASASCVFAVVDPEGAAGDRHVDKRADMPFI